MSTDGRENGPERPAPPSAAVDVGSGAFRLRYQPGLDGLRGLALLAIVVYHADIGWAPGAFLSVSTFFTLSGFLITAVMLGERASTGRISLLRFWPRRLRRLLPAALVAITGTVLASAVLADSSQLVRLRGDALASLFYVANWRFIELGDAYGSYFGTPSPFMHYWTLSIEEQFYVVFPLLLIAVVAVGRGRPRAVGALLAGLGLLSVAWSVVLIRGGAATDRVYFGTDARAAELLAGAVLAVWWMRRPDPVPARARPWVRGLGAASLVAVLVLWSTASLAQRAYYQGGLALYSLLTLAVLLAVMEGGVVNRVLSFRPLVTLGVLSYGAYLFHWPILVWLGVHTGLGSLGRLAVGLALTIALAALSYRFVERPIRDGRLVSTSAARWAAPASVAAVVVLIVGMFVWRPVEETYDFAGALAEAETTGSIDFDDMTDAQREDWARYVELTELRERMTASGAPTVATFGDSTALLNGVGLSTWAESSFSETDVATIVPRQGWSQLGCGLVSDSPRRHKGEIGEPPEICHGWWESWEEAAADRSPQIAVVMLGPWDVLDVRPDGFDEFAAVGDPRIDELLRERIRLGIDALAPHADVVVLTLSPPIEIGRVDGRSPSGRLADNDPARMRRFNELLSEAADEDPDVAVLDLASWIADRDDDAVLRPDGVHFTEESAIVAAEWIGPELARLHAEWDAAQP